MSQPLLIQIFPISQIGWALVKPKFVRLRQMVSLEGRFLWTAEFSVRMQNDYVFLPPGGSTREFFFSLYSENLVGLLEVNDASMGALLRLSPSGFLTVKLIYTIPQQVITYSVRVPTGRGFCPWLAGILFACLSNLGGCGLPGDFNSLMDLGRIVDMFVQLCFCVCV